jgi:hypothetical protein
MGVWADIKAQARRTVHETFSREATYVGPCSTDDPVALRVRWHPAGSRVGELGSDGYAVMMVTEDRVVFDLEQIATLGVTPERLAVVTITDETPQIVLTLDSQFETSGPVADVWRVTRA